MIQHLFMGTIFLIAPNVWMTADHVLNAPWVQNHKDYYDAEEISQNTLYDIATFKKESVGEPLKLECREMIVGETITIKGFPFIDAQYTYTELTGKVVETNVPLRAYFSDDTWHATEVDIPVIGGFSGSPALDSDGDVVGVVSGRTNEGDAVHHGYITSVCGIKS